MPTAYGNNNIAAVFNGYSAKNANKPIRRLESGGSIVDSGGNPIGGGGGGLSYQGTWDASSGSAPDASPTNGEYWAVSVAGTTDLDGITDWAVGDWAIYNGTAWQKIDNTTSNEFVTLSVTSTDDVTSGVGGLTAPTELDGGLYVKKTVYATSGFVTLNDVTATGDIIAGYTNIVGIDPVVAADNWARLADTELDFQGLGVGATALTSYFKGLGDIHVQMYTDGADSTNNYTALAVTGGNVLVGTTTDDGTNKLQVNGGMKATGITNSGTEISRDVTNSTHRVLGGTSTSNGAMIELRGGTDATLPNCAFLDYGDYDGAVTPAGYADIRQRFNSTYTTVMRFFESGRIGIGATTDRSTGVLQLEGAASSLESSQSYHIDGDADPMLQILTFNHDSMAITFDAWYDPNAAGGAGWISSDATSNFQLRKVSDQLIIQYNASTAKGSEMSGWDGTAFAVGNTGRLMIGGAIDDGTNALQVNGSIASTTPWVGIATSRYTATPTDTNTLAMSDTDGLYVGQPLRYTIGGTVYYGIVDALTADTSIDVRGAPLSGNVTKLEVGPAGLVRIETYVVPGIFDDAADANLLANDAVAPAKWEYGAAYCVGFDLIVGTDDSGATQPKINVQLANSAVSTSNTNAGIAASETWTGTAVDINTTNYSVANGEEVEVATDGTGTNSDTQDLTVQAIFVLKGEA